MNGLMRYRQKTAVAVGLLFALMLPGAGTLAQNGNPNPRVFPPNSNPYGKSYGEWSAALWQWAYQFPVSQSPILDTTGALANAGQSGPVFFIAGAGSAERTFSVPAGKAILFPILAFENDNNCVSPPLSPDQLLAGAITSIDGVTEMHVSLDGVPLQGLFSYRFTSPFFSYTLPAGDNLAHYFGCDVSGVISPAVSNGYWIMLAPLPPGHHDLSMGGTIGPPANFSFTLICHITVTP